jgi:hypothetical protein
MAASGNIGPMKAACFTAFFALTLFCAPGLRAQEGPVVLPEMAPMPAARPSEAPPRPGSAPQRIEIPAAEIDAAAKICQSVLAKNTMIAENAEGAVWNNGCGAAGQIQVSAIKLQNGKEVTLRPSALIRCETAEVIADWVREDLAPASESYGGLVRIEVAASYHCRPRNNVRGALMSEHGRANALDVRAIVMSNGRRFGVDLPETPITLLSEMRRSACARFTTVLGPGSDGYHENHFHVDLAQRRGGYRLCQWNLPRPPEPARHPLRVADPSKVQPASP